MKRIAFIVALGFLCGAPVAHAADAKKENKEKESYLQKSDAKVQEWTAKMRTLQEKSEKSGSETRNELDEKLKVVNEKLAVARHKLDDLRTSSEGSWKSLREGLDRALSEVRRATDKAQSFFNKTEMKVKRETT